MEVSCHVTERSEVLRGRLVGLYNNLRSPLERGFSFDSPPKIPYNNLTVVFDRNYADGVIHETPHPGHPDLARPIKRAITEVAMPRGSHFARDKCARTSGSRTPGQYPSYCPSFLN